MSSVVRPPVRASGGASPLARCVGDTPAFLERAWGRRAEVHARVDAVGYADLLTFDEVDRILSTTSIRTPSFRLVRSDRTIAESEYTRSGTTGSRPVAGMADPARVFELFRGGATIVLQGLHRFWEPVAELTRGLELELGHPCQVNAYVTPPGAQGLALHDDPHDVFVLQAFGRKHWEVHAAPGEPAREPIQAVVEPGDCIYMPTGTPHAASTQDTLSGHLTVGVHVATWRDVVADAWRRVERDPSLDEPLPPGWLRDPDRLASELAERLGRLGSRLGGVDAGEIASARIDRFLSTRNPMLRGSLVDQLALGDDRRRERGAPPSGIGVRAAAGRGSAGGPARRPAPGDAGLARAGDAADRRVGDPAGGRPGRGRPRPREPSRARVPARARGPASSHALGDRHR